MARDKAAAARRSDGQESRPGARLRGVLAGESGGSMAELLFILFVFLLASLAGATAWIAYFGSLFDAWEETYGDEVPYMIPTFEPPPTPDLSFLTPSPTSEG